MNTKRCSKCKQEKSLSAFYWIASRGRYHSQCSDCRRGAVKGAYDTDPERQKEYHRERYASDLEVRMQSRAVVVAWLEAHPGKAAEYAQERRARLAEAVCDHVACLTIDRRVVWGRDEGHCRIKLVCTGIFVPFEKMHLDHIIPLVGGGLHCYGNVQTGCAPCNLSKSGRILEEVC